MAGVATAERAALLRAGRSGVAEVRQRAAAEPGVLALCDLLDALEHDEVHHAKDNWPVVDRLLAASAAVPLELLEVAFDKALGHSNPAIGKVVLRQLLDDWERFVTQDHYLRLEPWLVFRTLLPGMNARSLFRVIVLDDSTGRSGSLFRVEERLPALLKLWFDDLCTKRGPDAAPPILAEFVAAVSSIAYGANLPLALALMRALLALDCPTGPWLGNAQVAQLLELATAIRTYADGEGTTRLAHAVFKLVPAVLAKHAGADLDDIDTTLRLLRTSRTPAAVVAPWLHQHASLAPRAVETFCRALARAEGWETRAFQPALAAYVAQLLSPDETLLSRCLGPLVEILAGAFDRPYQPAHEKNRAALVLEACVAAGLPIPDLRRVHEQLANWAVQLVQTELASASSVPPEALAAATDSPDSPQVFYAVRGAACSGNDLDPQLWTIALELLGNAATLQDALRALGVLAPLAKAIKLPHDAWEQSLCAIVALQPTALAGNSDAASYDRSALRIGAEGARWRAIHGLVVKAQPDAVLSDGTYSCLLCACLEGFDICSEHHMPVLFEVLQRVLGQPPTVPVDWDEVWSACLAATRSAFRNSQDDTLRLVQTLFQPYLFRDQTAIDAVLRPAWSHLVRSDASHQFGHLALAKHCVNVVMMAQPELAQGWAAELVEMARHALDLSTSQTADVATLELCAMLASPFNTVLGVQVHPATFCHRAVLALVPRLHYTSVADVARVALANLGQIARTPSRQAVHCKEAYEHEHLFSLFALCCASLSQDKDVPREVIQGLVDEILAELYFSECNHRARFGIELSMLNLLLTPMPGLIDDFLDRVAAEMYAQRQAVQTSTLAILGVLAHRSSLDDRDRLLERISAAALPFVAVSDVLCRAIAVNIVAPAFSHLAKLPGDKATCEFLAHASKVMEWKETAAILRNSLRNFCPRRVASVEESLSYPVNAYGEAMCPTLIARINAEVDAFLLDKYGKVRRTVPMTRELVRSGGDHRAIAEAEAKALFSQATEQLNAQQKIDPNAAEPPKASPLIVVASLLEELPSVAALARTSEIFAAGGFVLADKSMLEDELFKCISVAASALLQMEEAPVTDLLGYLLERKREGYWIVGLDQLCSADALPLASTEFPADGKVVLLCGDEHRGIPVPLLSACDAILGPPHRGNSRALQQHIFAGLAVWEYTKQRIVRDSGDAVAQYCR